MQEGAAGAVDGAGILARQRQDVAFFARLVVEFDVRESFPAAPDADDFAIVFGASIGHFFDDGIEAGDITAAGENANAFV